jgi:hypothetical protein
MSARRSASNEAVSDAAACRHPANSSTARILVTEIDDVATAVDGSAMSGPPLEVYAHLDTYYPQLLLVVGQGAIV